MVAVGGLAARDPRLAAIVERIGPPPLWDRPPGFSTLLHIVLEQQVSLASAQAAFDRLLAASGVLTPARFLAFDDAELLAIGFSRQKARYGRALAAAIVDGTLDLEALERRDDDAVREALEAETDPSVRLSLARALWRHDASAARSALSELAVRGEGMPRAQAASLLAAEGDRAAVDALRELLHGGDSLVRRTAARALARDAMSPDAVRALLRDEDALVRIYAAGGILAAAAASTP